MRYHSTEYPISWLKDRHAEGNLVLQKPMLQRKLVWKLPQKSALAESVLMRYPIPEVFIQQKTTATGESTFVVVDGQQRMAAILAFIGIKDDDEHNGFDLHLLKDSDFRNLSWTDLTDEQKMSFYSYKIAARVLDDATDDEVRDMFKRLNKNLMKLTDQELCNATYSGPLLSVSMDTEMTICACPRSCPEEAVWACLKCGMKLCDDCVAGETHYPHECEPSKPKRARR